MSLCYHHTLFLLSLVPWPPPFFFCSSVCVQYNTWKRKSDKKRGRPGNTYHVNDVRWTRGGHRGGGVQLQVHAQYTWERVLTGPVEYSWSCERLGSCLAVEHSMMNSSTLFNVFEYRLLPPASNSRPPDIIHMVSVLRYSPFSPLFHFCVLHWIQTEELKQGRPGNGGWHLVSVYY